MSIDPRITVRWPAKLRWYWIAARLKKVIRRNKRRDDTRGHRFAEWEDHGGEA